MPPCSFSIFRLNMVLPHGIPPAVRDGVHIIIYRQPPLGQSRVYQVTQLRTDSVHCRESAGTGTDSVVLKVVPVTGAAFSGFTMNQVLMCASLFPINIGIK